MAARNGAAHVVTTTRKYKGREYRTHLLRRSYREDGKVKNETLGNLSHLPEPTIDLIRRSLKGEQFVPANDAFQILGSRAHGHVQVVQRVMQRLDFASLIGSKACEERDSVLAMVAARILQPGSKLATTRWWHCTTLAEEFNVSEANEDDLYQAMDWLLARQNRIERKLAARHLKQGALALYDLSSSYFEGSTCPLAALGYSRDNKRGKLQVNYGLLTDVRGCPIAISVHEGNTADSVTFAPMVEHLRKDFKLEQLVMVGDRGMISHKAIKTLQQLPGVDWISALKHISIRSLMNKGHLQIDLFDDTALFELSSPDYPNERLIACRNEALARRRAHKRESLLCATESKLEEIQARVRAGKLTSADKIGVRVGKVVNKYKVAKHMELTIEDNAFTFRRHQKSIEAEATLDGVYIIRTSVAPEQMDSAECVRSYKALTRVEQAFRSIKAIDLKVRPIHHRLEDRVRAHLLLCMLAYYVEWHIRDAWRELTFTDTEQAAKATRDPVAPARRSASATRKAVTRTLDDGTPTHSVSTLMSVMATITRNTCRSPHDPELHVFNVDTVPTAKQRRALELIETIEL
ncbi:MAG: IS1634 family transposase [Granulosicoccus sp.]|nr:IS1634 family transposase [Granulosicoccus sp.]